MKRGHGSWASGRRPNSERTVIYGLGSDGVEIRSFITPVGAVVGKSVTTLEGLPALYARQHNQANPLTLHPLQRALIEEQAPQCGYCYNGMTIKGSELLANNPQPSEWEIREAARP
jgi:aerobic-type carbon monoxide dehydrogenase small subunit (CoxS/CutS family)